MKGGDRMNESILFNFYLHFDVEYGQNILAFHVVKFNYEIAVTAVFFFA